MVSSTNPFKQSIWFIDGSLLDTTRLDKNEPVSNGDEGMLYSL